MGGLGVPNTTLLDTWGHLHEKSRFQTNWAAGGP